MKKLIIVLLFLFSYPLFSQVVSIVHDPKAHWTATTKYLEDKEAQLKERLQNLKLITKTAKLLENAKATKEKIEKMWNLQDQIRKELKTCADGIKQLDFNSVVYLGSQLVGKSFNPADYIPETDFSSSLKSALNYNYTEKVSKETQHVFREWFTSNPDNPSDLLSYTTELGNLITNSNEYRGKNAIARALEDLDFSKNMDVLIDSIFKVINNDSQIELSDADRLNFNMKLAEIEMKKREKADAARLKLVEINLRANKIRLHEYNLKLNFGVMEALMDSTLKFRANPKKIPRLAKFDKTLK